jgi:5-methyltetrahydropteroyltriglutamate--homocysteine methyltransferase
LNTAPPFRAEHIGSLLRPRHLLELRRKHATDGKKSGELLAAERQAIEEVVALQQRVGLKLATDGELRRSSYHSYFYQQLGDVTLEPPPEQKHASGVASQPQAVIGSRLAWKQPIHVDDFKLLRGITSAVPKITIPGPCALHFRGGDAAITATAYSNTDDFWSDIVDAFRKELHALAEAGCTYVQIDETAFAKFGDPDVQATLAARGEQWDALIDRYIAITNRVLDGLPATLNVGMHLCRGNRAGQWHSQGSYDAVADKLFNALAIKFFFLEYDTPRAGDFTPLRLVPNNKSVILGLVSTKTSALENKDELKRKLDDASRYVAVERLGISPQCGFASVAEGNPITPQAQEAKLRLVVEVANDVWGSA